MENVLKHEVFVIKNYFTEDEMSNLFIEMWQDENRRKNNLSFNGQLKSAISPSKTVTITLTPECYGK